MTLLAIENLCAGYGPIKVLHDVSLHVDEGEIVTLIGANGAGKSTALRAVSRLIPIISGVLMFKNENIRPSLPMQSPAGALPTFRRAEVFSGTFRCLKTFGFPPTQNRSGPVSKLLSTVFDTFPVLAERKRQLASTLSGGEQQMLAIGRALIADGDLFIFDEPSMGLSPIFVKNVFSIIADIHKKGKTVLLVEQNATMALKISNRAYVLENGRSSLKAQRNYCGKCGP